MIRHSVNLGMSLSVILFMLGYYYRKININRHRFLMAAGVGANLISATILLVGVYVYSGGDMRAAGFHPQAPFWAITAHRLLAAVALGMMLVMLYSGLARKRELHVGLHRFFLPIYIVVYFSGIYIFGGPPS